MTEKQAEVRQPFAEAFADIMRAKYGDEMGNFALRPVLSQVHGYSYEALRLMLKGERTLEMEASAKGRCQLECRTKSEVTQHRSGARRRKRSELDIGPLLCPHRIRDCLQNLSIFDHRPVRPLPRQQEAPKRRYGRLGVEHVLLTFNGREVACRIRFVDS